VATGCTIPTSIYISENHKSRYQDLEPISDKINISLDIQFYDAENKHHPQLENAHLTHFQRVLRKTGFINPFKNDSNNKLSIIIRESNKQDTNGFSNKLYSYELNYTDKNNKAFEKKLTEEVFFAILNKDAPKENLIKVPNSAIARSKMVENILIAFLKDLHINGMLK
jgi:hypothetical protein